MRTPIDKLSNHNDIIQIIVTRKCDLFHCSNCTQLLPFRQDAVEMSVDCFIHAVESVKEWPGVVAMFGGNPATHSRFPELCEILVDLIPDQRRRGLWCNNVMEHGSLIRKTFYPDGRFNMNAHGNAQAAMEIEKWLPGKLIIGTGQHGSMHGPLLMHYADAGIAESEWPAVREQCDINRYWSAAIVERDGKPFAYFCEVGAALDGVRGENNGIPAVPGWWKFSIDQYGDQIAKCCDRGCGVPLRMKPRQDTADTYDVSPKMVPLTIGKKVKTFLHDRPEPTQVRDRSTKYAGETA